MLLLLTKYPPCLPLHFFKCLLIIGTCPTRKQHIYPCAPGTPYPFTPDDCHPQTCRHLTDIWLFALCAPYSQIYNLQTRGFFVHTIASQCTKPHLAHCKLSHTFSKETNRNKVTKSILSQRLRQWINFPTCQVMFELGLCKQTEGAELKSSHIQVRERSFSTTVPALSHETQQGAWFSFSSKIIPLSASLRREKELQTIIPLEALFNNGPWIVWCLYFFSFLFLFPKDEYVLILSWCKQP